MVLKSDKEKVKTLLSETIRLLCKNGLHFKSEFSVEALVGITLDKDQEFFLSIKETVKTDIPLPKPESRSQKEARRSSAKEVKGEPNEPPSCVRKRPSETVTNNGSPSDLPPSLSLGDMHDNESGFWGPEGDDGGGQATKKKRIDPNDDDSNSNVITIKGEPGSDSDDDVACMGESSDRDSQMDQTMGDMSGSFMYATPVTSEQSMMGGLPPGGSMPQGVWDHLPQFPIPGPSGMAGGADVSQDGQQPRQAALPGFQLNLAVDGMGTRLPPVSSWLGVTPGFPLPFTSLPASTAALKHEPPQTGVPPPSLDRENGAKVRCTHCGVLCANRTSLQRHMKIHLGSPQFHCPQCGQSYYDHWRLMRHQRAKHCDISQQADLTGVSGGVTLSQTDHAANHRSTSGSPAQPQSDHTSSSTAQRLVLQEAIGVDNMDQRGGHHPEAKAQMLGHVTGVVL